MAQTSNLQTTQQLPLLGMGYVSIMEKLFLLQRDSNVQGHKNTIM